MQKYFWMAVTADKYELPVAVAESSSALAAMLGVHQGTVLACEARNKSGRNTGRKIIKIKFDKESEDLRNGYNSGNRNII